MKNYLTIFETLPVQTTLIEFLLLIYFSSCGEGMNDDESVFTDVRKLRRVQHVS